MSKSKISLKIKTNFDKDIAHHEIRIVLDDAEYRMIECRRPGTSDRSFTITTTPFCLAYTGDMGTFVFSKHTARDMFEFFKSTSLRDGLPYGYWAGKLDAGNHREFDADTAILQVFTLIGEAEPINFEFTPYESMEDLRSSLESTANEYGEWAYFDAVSELMGALEIDDWYETCKYAYKPTYHYIWCCYAILWAIGQYDSTVNKDA